MWEELIRKQVTNIMDVQFKEKGTCDAEECFKLSENYKHCPYPSIKLLTHADLTKMCDDKYNGDSKPAAVSPGASDTTPNQESCEFESY